MKLQNLSIIFLVIVIPLIMILSYYLSLQQDTLKLQAEYDIKLGEATNEGIKAFEINTVDWSEWISDKNRLTEREDASAAINTFINSLSNKLNMSGTAKEYMVSYIPAVAVTMYDGYYIYAPNYLPITIEDNKGVQLYYDAEKDILTIDSKNGTNLPIYTPKAGASSIKTKTYTYINNNDDEVTKNISFVTDIDEAETEYKHILSNQIAYVEKYSNSSNTNVVVNYTLDNRIYVYGTVKGENVEKNGYLVYFNSDSEMPRISLKANNLANDSAIEVHKGLDNTTYDKIQVGAEILEEQILYLTGTEKKLGKFKYIYDINHDKLYYDEAMDNFFTIDSTTKEKNFINNSDSIKMGSDQCKYKSVSVLLGDTATTEYKKIYQVLNGKDKGKWCISITDDSEDAVNEEIEEIDTEIQTAAILTSLGVSNNKIYHDYSAISYYVESYAFTNWARENLRGLKIYNKDTGLYEDIKVEGTVTNIFDINGNNNPEEEYSPIAIHKKEVMKNHIITNLNLSISNYSMGTYNFKLPVLTDTDWEQVFGNISLISFFQGMPIGLKYYNNYAIATSTTNREYVDPGEIYFSGNDQNYHKAFCKKMR